MKKIAYIGILILFTLCVGCTKETISVEEADDKVTAMASDVDKQEGSSKIEELTNEDFEPFFTALYGYSEETLERLNRNDEINYSGYFQDLNFYKEQLSKGMGTYFSDSLNRKLLKENIQLDMDLPKKVKINDYILNASGQVNKTEVESSRESGEGMIYKIAVTSTNKVVPVEAFFNEYGWSAKLGYYAKKDEIDDVVGVTFKDVIPDSLYACDKADQVKVVSHYEMEVSEPEKGSKIRYQVEGLKQAGNFDVDEDKKQGILNSQYIERVPYYEKVSAKEKGVMVDVMTKLFNASKEQCSYYEMTSEASYELFQTALQDLEIADELSVREVDYKQAFPITINPYKDNVTTFKLESKKIQILPSLYSTKYQPAFVVSIPATVQMKGEEESYLVYKYFVRMENEKIETIEFIKMNSISKAEYESFEITSDTQMISKGSVKEVSGAEEKAECIEKNSD